MSGTVLDDHGRRRLHRMWPSPVICRDSEPDELSGGSAEPPRTRLRFRPTTAPHDEGGVDSPGICPEWARNGHTWTRGRHRLLWSKGFAERAQSTKFRLFAPDHSAGGRARPAVAHASIPSPTLQVGGSRVRVPSAPLLNRLVRTGLIRSSPVRFREVTQRFIPRHGVFIAAS